MILGICWVLSTSLLLSFVYVDLVSTQNINSQPIKPIGPKSCCYGDGFLKHGEVVFNHAPRCFQLVCLNGLIQPQYAQKKGDLDCCEFNNLLYPNGSEIAGYCMPLQCLNGTWITKGKIEKCCDHCYIYNDPHIRTFDDHKYDWHGTCNYSIAQTGFAVDPDYGIFGKFQSCNGLASCLSYTTFKNDPHTVVTIFDREVLKLSVNGDDFNVTEIVQTVRSTSGKHPMLSWKHGNCTFLLGSSKLLLLHCRHRLDIWAHPLHMGNLNGLCGHYNQRKDDDLTRRDATVQRPLTYWPLAFPQSWLTPEPDGRICKPPCPTCKSETSDITIDPCNANPSDRSKYFELCKGSLQTLNDTEGFQQYLETCAFDVCMLHQAGGEETQIENWIAELQNLINVTRTFTKDSTHDFARNFK